MQNLSKDLLRKGFSTPPPTIRTLPQRKLGFFSRSKRPGAARIPKPGSQARFSRAGSQARFSRKGSQDGFQVRFAGISFQGQVSKSRFPGTGFQEQVPKRGCQAKLPGTDMQARCPGTGVQAKSLSFTTDGQSKVYLGLLQTALKHHSDKDLLTFHVVVAVGDIL